MGALITAGYLMRAPDLRENAHVDVLYISARDADGDDILGFAGGGTRVTADAPRVIDYLGPLHTIFAPWWLVDHLPD